MQYISLNFISDCELRNAYLDQDSNFSKSRIQMVIEKITIRNNEYKM